MQSSDLINNRVDPVESGISVNEPSVDYPPFMDDVLKILTQYDYEFDVCEGNLTPVQVLQATVGTDDVQLYRSVQTVLQLKVSCVKDQVFTDKDNYPNLLTYACDEEHWNAASEILAYSDAEMIAAPITDGPDEGMNALYLAAFYKNWKLVRQMLALCNSDAINSYAKFGPEEGKTVLYFAVEDKEWDIVLLLLPLCTPEIIGMTAKSDRCKGINPLWNAARIGEWRIVNLLVEKCHPEAISACCVAENEYKNINALLLAVSAESWMTVRLMLAKCHPDAILSQSLNGPNSLALAVNYKREDIVKQMLSMCSLQAINASWDGLGIHDGTNALWWLCYNEMWACAPAMLAKCDAKSIEMRSTDPEDLGTNALYWAVIYRQKDVVISMLDKCSPEAINTCSLAEDDDQGKNALWFAAFFSDWDIVLKMLAKCDSFAIGKMATCGLHVGTTPLYWAVYYKRWEIVRAMLLKCQAHTLIIPAPETPFELVLSSGKSDLIEIMLDLAEDEDLLTEFISSTAKEHKPDLVKVLRERNSLFLESSPQMQTVLSLFPNCCKLVSGKLERVKGVVPKINLKQFPGLQNEKIKAQEAFAAYLIEVNRFLTTIGNQDNFRKAFNERYSVFLKELELQMKRYVLKKEEPVLKPVAPKENSPAALEPVEPEEIKKAKNANIKNILSALVDKPDSLIKEERALLELQSNLSKETLPQFKAQLNAFRENVTSLQQEELKQCRKPKSKNEKRKALRVQPKPSKPVVAMPANIKPQESKTAPVSSADLVFVPAQNSVLPEHFPIGDLILQDNLFSETLFKFAQDRMRHLSSLCSRAAEKLPRKETVDRYALLYNLMKLNHAIALLDWSKCYSLSNRKELGEKKAPFNVRNYLAHGGGNFSTIPLDVIFKWAKLQVEGLQAILRPVKNTISGAKSFSLPDEIITSMKSQRTESALEGYLKDLKVLYEEYRLGKIAFIDNEDLISAIKMLIVLIVEENRTLFHGSVKFRNRICHDFDDLEEGMKKGDEDRYFSSEDVPITAVQAALLKFFRN